jgi:hypothetical protein
MRTFLPHDGQVDRRPTSFGLAAAGKVFPGNVGGCVRVGVNLISARSAPKQGLRRMVAPMPVTTLAAPLAGVPKIDSHHNGACRLSLVISPPRRAAMRSRDWPSCARRRPNAAPASPSCVQKLQAATANRDTPCAGRHMSPDAATPFFSCRSRPISPTMLRHEQDADSVASRT